MMRIFWHVNLPRYALGNGAPDQNKRLNHWPILNFPALSRHVLFR
jgi:hypothetical protein